MTAVPHFRRRLCLGVDLFRYSRHDTDAHLDGQARLVRILEHACRRAGVPRVRVQGQDQGDGRLLVLPTGADDVHVVPELILGLRDGLYRSNASPGLFGRIRMRAAVGHGRISRAPSGYIGEGVIEVSRLVDSRPVRDALERREESDLALAVTAGLYQDVLALDLPGLPAEQFQAITVHLPEKDFRAEAWLYVPRSAPVRDLGPSPVRWGYSPTRTAMREFVVPAVTAAHVAASAVSLLGPSSPLREWFFPSHDHPAPQPVVPSLTADTTHDDGPDTFDDTPDDTPLGAHHHGLGHHQDAGSTPHHADPGHHGDPGHHAAGHDVDDAGHSSHDGHVDGHVDGWWPHGGAAGHHGHD
ncbi:MAG TPA: hypothetical protein VI248_14250 [Kineosporiaceae bacterium]